MLAALVVITVISALVSTGFSLAGVFLPGIVIKDGEGSHTVRVFALYSLARSLALLLVVLLAAFRADGTALIWLGTLTGVIQLGDAAIGTQTGDHLKVWGPLGLGIVQLIVVVLAIGFMA